MELQSKRPKVMSRHATKKSNAVMSNKRQRTILNDEIINQYLVTNPDYFIRNAKKAIDFKIFHSVRGEISLSQWQSMQQRQRIKQLESKINLLIEQASVNESLFESLLGLQNQLLSSISLEAMLMHLNDWAKSLGLSGAYLYLFDDKWQLNVPSSYQHLALSADKFEFIRIRHLQYSNLYLGELNSTEANILIADDVYAGSVALSLLGKFGDLGVLMFVSSSSYHYQAGQGTLLLEKISAILPFIISRFIPRKS